MKTLSLEAHEKPNPAFSLGAMVQYLLIELAWFGLYKNGNILYAIL